MQKSKYKKVNIFVTCLVDNFFPEVGEAMVNVLSRLGLDINFIESQTCCGQPAYNSGYQNKAKDVAIHFLETFKNVDTPIICPSGSCVSMIKVYYKDIFKYNFKYKDIVNQLNQRTYEFTDFLVNQLNTTNIGALYNGRVTYHDSCHLLRELGIEDEPRKLIESVEGIEFIEMDMHDACCGFGGTFAVKNPHVSISMLEEKINSAIKTGADTIVSTDMGCLMNINGLISRKNLHIKTMHIAQLLGSV